MKGNYSSKFKKAALGLTAIASSLLIGMTAACSTNNDNDTPDEEENKVTSRVDLQDIKNGNFEYYDDNEGLYPISTPDSWSFSYSGTNSTSMSGIIKTSKEGWDYITDTSLPDTLKANDELSSDNKDKKDYNGALSDDMLYKNMHDALDDTAADDDNEDKKAYIANPNTHNLRWDESKGGYVYVNDEGVESPVHTKDGKVYSDEACTNEIGTGVLMIHNYRKNYLYGNEGYYNSSTTISLEANTTCKISLWVKTAELYCDDSKGERSKVTFNKGAYIKVNTAVGGNDLDSFTIKNINTENSEMAEVAAANNGWVQYTVYVQASSFATTTVNLTLGLGENGSKGINTVEGYAFFDDITFEKYLNLDELKKDNTDFDTVIRNSDDGSKLANTCYPLANDARTEFRVDVPKNKTQDENGNIVDNIVDNNSEDRKFFIDHASTEALPLMLNDTTVKAGLTVDSDKYVSSKNTGVKTFGIGNLDNGADNAKVPTNLKDNGLAVSDDLLAITNINDGWSLAVDGLIYNNLLTDSLKSAAKLPGVTTSANTLVMLSANGATYESKIADPAFTIKDGEYKLLSFWLKTSDFAGKTAATVTVYDVDDEDNTSNFTLDTTTVSATDFGDNKDIYNGWVRCFIRVSNNSGDVNNAQNFGIKVNLGRTAIKGTTANDYKYGWLALSNLSVMDLDEDVYGYTSGLTNTAELSFTETTETYSKVFDSEQGGTNSQIKTDLATPSTYMGANGASVAVKPTGAAATDYDTTNNNKFAGLLNKENLANYKNTAWYTPVLGNMPGVPDDHETIWNAFAGKYSYQPLLIVNSVREVSNGVSGVYNYGYIGNNQSFSSDSYKKVSVKVKVSKGAIAYVYLVDTNSENNDVLTYKTPNINFYYDDDGNILKEAADSKDTKDEAKAKIAYTLRKDGLYENGDGKLYANFYNLSKYYDYKYEHESFFDEEGNAVKFENLATGATYYADAAKTKYAPHYLIAGGKENNKVYEYVSGLGDSATYYYVEKGVANQEKLVYGVDKNIASYTYDAATATPYSFKIDGNNEKYADKWITVTFNVHTGNEAKNYRLELWAGERDQKQTAGVTENSYVLFDYSPEQETALDSSTYSSKLGYYTDAIRSDLIENITTELPDNEQNIDQLAVLAGSDYNRLYNYDATYYTFSLYDSPAFIPFNATTAEEGQAGYSYLYSDYEESLALLKVEDTDDENNYSMTAFVDYSVADKAFDIIGEPTVDTETEHDHEHENENEETPNVWLLATSIAIVVAIFVAIVAIMVKQLLSKSGKNKKHVGKNTYNFNKNKRYVKKYVKANGEAPEVSEDEVDATVEQPVEEQPTAEQEATSEETPATAEENNGEGSDENKPE